MGPSPLKTAGSAMTVAQAVELEAHPAEEGVKRVWPAAVKRDREAAPVVRQMTAAASTRELEMAALGAASQASTAAPLAAPRTQFSVRVSRAATSMEAPGS